jgi:RimJ/RimL family protein N-acetyltransferase
VCDFAFRQLSARRIEWQAIVGNVASRKVADRTGFTFEGVTRRRLSRRGEAQDAWLASLLPGDPMERTRDRLLPWSAVDLTRFGVTLRAVSPSEASWVLQAYRDSDIAQWNPGDVNDLQDAHRWVSERADWSSGSHASWLFADPGNDQPCGAISLHKVNEENLSASVGYWTHPAHRGAGWASRALQVAAAWAIEEVGLRRLEIIHAVENPVSCRVATAAGFDWEGTTRCGERYGDGRWYDEHIHGRIQPSP